MLALLAAVPCLASLLVAPTPPESVATDAVSTVGAMPSSQPEKKHEDPKQPEKKPVTPPAPAKPEPAEPTTEDILKDMEKQRGNTPTPSPAPTAPPSTTPAPAPAAPGEQPRRASGPTRLLREGTFLVDRRGRLVRSPNGEWNYTFDTDAQGQADPMMTVMPCQKLEAMEKLAERYGESLTFTVTGRVFVYKNRNYLLPEIFRTNRATGDIKSAQ